MQQNKDVLVSRLKTDLFSRNFPSNPPPPPHPAPRLHLLLKLCHDLWMPARILTDNFGPNLDVTTAVKMRQVAGRVYVFALRVVLRSAGASSVSAPGLVWISWWLSLCLRNVAAWFAPSLDRIPGFFSRLLIIGIVSNNTAKNTPEIICISRKENRMCVPELVIYLRNSCPDFISSPSLEIFQITFYKPQVFFASARNFDSSVNDHSDFIEYKPCHVKKKLWHSPHN